MADQAVVSLANFTTGVLLAKSVSPHDFGFYSLLFSALLLLGSLQNALITGPMRVLGVRATPQEADDYLAMQFVLQTLTGMVLAVGAALVLWLSDVDLMVTLAFAASIFLVQMQEYYRVRCYAISSIRLLFVLDVVTYGGRLLLLFILVFMDFVSVGWAFFVIAITSALGALIQVKAMPFRRLSLDNASRGWIQNWGHARWLLPETVVYILSNQLYVYLIALWVDVQSAGVFSAVCALINVVSVVFSGVANFAFPEARRRLISRDYFAWRNWILRIGGVLLIVGVIAAIILAVFAETLLSKLYTPFFGQYAHIAQILCIFLLFHSINTVFSIAFRSAELPKAGFTAKVASAVVMIVTAYPLLHSLGAAGAAWGSVVLQLTWTMMYSIRVLRGDLSEHTIAARLNRIVFDVPSVSDMQRTG